MNSFRSLLLALSLFPMAAMAIDASDVFLSEKKISIPDDAAVLVRTADSPKTVKIEMTLPMGQRVCEEYDYRDVFGRHPSCGYETYFVQRWTTYCVAWGTNPRGGARCLQWRRGLETYPVQRMLSCHYEVRDCVRYGTATRLENRKVKLVFGKAAKLEGSDQETFLLSATQASVGSRDVVFSLTPLETKSGYEMKESDFFGDRIKVKKSDDPEAYMPTMNIFVAPAAMPVPK